MADLEGQLETRGPGIVGKWEPQFFRLKGDTLYALEGQDLPSRQYHLKEITHFSAEPRKRECQFEFQGVKVRLRAPDEAEAKRWFSRIKEANSGCTMCSDEDAGSEDRFWVQCDTIYGLPVETLGKTGTYSVRARFKAGKEAQETQECKGRPQQGSPELEDCVIQQQVLLTTTQGQRSILVNVVRRSDAGSTLIGTVELNAARHEHQTASHYSLFNQNGDPTGVTIRLKIKVGTRKQQQGREQRARSEGPPASARKADLPDDRTVGFAGEQVSSYIHTSLGEEQEPKIGSPRRDDTSQVSTAVPKDEASPETPPATSKTLTSRSKSSRNGDRYRGEPSTERSPSTGSQRKCSTPRKSVVRKSHSSEGFDGELVPLLLDKVIDLLHKHQFRVIDLFRHPHFNPSYLTTRDEELDAKEVAEVLHRAGAEVDPKSVRMLCRCLDLDGSRTIGIRELESAVRERRRGKDKWIEAIVMQKTSTGFKRGAYVDAAKNSPEAILDLITELLDVKHLRVTDLFRHPQYNPSYLATGDEELTAPEIAKILSKAGLEIEVEDVKRLVYVLDSDGSGEIGIDEMEMALRTSHRGVKVWETEEFKQKKKEQDALRRRRHRTASQQARRAQQLHDMHEEKKKRSEDRVKNLIESEEQMKAQAIENNRVGTRKDWDPSQVQAGEKAMQLFEEAKAHKIRMIERTRRIEEEEQRKIDATRTNANVMPLSAREHDPYADLPVGDRLYHMAIDKNSNLKRKQAEVEAAHLKVQMAAENIGNKEVAQKRTQQLFEEAETRRQKREALRRANIEAEALYFSEQQVVLRAAGEMTPERYEDMYSIHAKKQMELERKSVEKQVAADKAIKASAKQAQFTRSKSTPAKLRNAKPKVLEHYLFDPTAAKQKTPRARTPKRENNAFGSTVPRAGIGAQSPPGISSDEPVEAEEGPTKSHTMLDLRDHAVRVVNSIVALRSGCEPDDGWEHSKNILNSLTTPIGKLMAEFREANRESERHSEGAVHLRNTPSQRIYMEGYLLDDPVGQHHCCEPMKIVQRTEDFDELMEEAEQAHWALLSLIGPEPDRKTGTVDPVALRKRWPVGCRWNHPRATKKATFAYNPGSKPKDKAWAKAFVRYGPCEGEKMYRHLLDLARVTLVFSDASLLRSGLQQIIDNFNVVAVKNFYHPSMQSLSGDKYVSVYIVISEGLRTPHICEIRLEEFHFYFAREKSAPEVAKISEAMRTIYHKRKCVTDPSAIDYLVRFTLTRPKTSHPLTVFHRHICRHYGSLVVAWRQAFGNGSHLEFNYWRDVCQSLLCREQTVEFWMETDSTHAGCISLFELDPHAVILLARFYARLMGMVQTDSEATVEALFNRLTAKMTPNKPGHLEAHEFREVLRPLGFNQYDADRLFHYLDGHGGSANLPPASVSMSDIAWLKKLPKLVHIDCALMTPADAATDIEALRMMSLSSDSPNKQRSPGENRDAAMSRFLAEESARQPEEVPSIKYTDTGMGMRRSSGSSHESGRGRDPSRGPPAASPPVPKAPAAAAPAEVAPAAARSMPPVSPRSPSPSPKAFEAPKMPAIESESPRSASPLRQAGSPASLFSDDYRSSPASRSVSSPEARSTAVPTGRLSDDEESEDDDVVF